MSGVPPDDITRLREAVLRGDVMAIEAMEAWRRWQDTPRERERARRHHRRSWERAAARALGRERRRPR